LGVVTAKKASSTSLRQAVASLDATSAQANTLSQLRAWRIKMAKRLASTSSASTPKGKK
jgi:hypothetical protein